MRHCPLPLKGEFMPYCLFRNCLCFRDRPNDVPECEGCIQTWTFDPVEKFRYEEYKKNLEKIAEKP